MKPCKRNERKLGVWGLAPKKFFVVTLFRMFEDGLLQRRIGIVFLIDLYAEREKLVPLNLFSLIFGN